MNSSQHIPVEQPVSGLQQPAYMLQEGFVAPRGVCLHYPWLIVADTAQNKVFIYKEENASFTLQLTLGNVANPRMRCSAAAFQYPSGIWTNGKLLMVADAWNHRVLIWQSFPTNDYQEADIVIGQKDFLSNDPNRDGLLAKPSAQSLYWPYGIWSNGTEIWIADTGNRRILYYENIPVSNGVAAAKVIGQQSFSDKEYDPDNPIWPYSVKISDNGEMLVADTQYYRCLYWKNWRSACTTKADSIIGQADIQSNGQNQFRLRPAANTLNWCYDACFIGHLIGVADTGNSRILLFNNTGQNNPVAEALLGQEQFDVIGESSLSMKDTGNKENHLYWPFSVSYDSERLAVADTGKSRILIYSIDPAA